jgi:hypothetical protein
MSACILCSPAGKKCLVLDIDYTLFDLNSSAERPDELARPYLHEFLSACYEFYDIIIWSATNMKWVEVRQGWYIRLMALVSVVLVRSCMIQLSGRVILSAVAVD